MAKNIPSTENQRPATKTTLSSKLSIKIEGQIRSFPDNKKPQRIHLLHTSYARDAKGFALRKGKKKSERESKTGIKKWQ